jgi:hypothetical protein
LHRGCERRLDAAARKKRDQEEVIEIMQFAFQKTAENSGVGDQGALPVPILRRLSM